MKKMKRVLLQIFLPLFLCGVMIFFSACAPRAGNDTAQNGGMTGSDEQAALYQRQAIDLMRGTVAQVKTDTGAVNSAVGHAAATDFAVRLFQTGMKKGQNTVFSPWSVWQALAMTANGAKGETRTQMEQVLGMTVEELNVYVYDRQTDLQNQLHVYNALWFAGNSAFVPDPDFLQKNADYYGADAYTVPNGVSITDEVNAWISEKTQGTIEKLLEPNAIPMAFYITDALYFQCLWKHPFGVTEGTFTCEDGTIKTVPMMHSSIGNPYLCGEHETGFVKYFYSDTPYALAVLLPEEGVAIDDYVASLTGERLAVLLRSDLASAADVYLPRFEVSNNTSLIAILQAMGMTDAFDVTKADLTGIGTYGGGENFAIGCAEHKSVLTVGEEGVEIAAATGFGGVFGEGIGGQEPVVVRADRPFVYTIFNRDTGVPFVIGTLMDPAA